MWLPVDAASSPLAAHGEVRARNFPIYVLNDSHKTLQMRAKVVKVILQILIIVSGSKLSRYHCRFLL